MLLGHCLSQTLLDHSVTLLPEQTNTARWPSLGIFVSRFVITGQAPKGAEVSSLFFGPLCVLLPNFLPRSWHTWFWEMENFKDWTPSVFCSCYVLLLTWEPGDLKTLCHELSWLVLYNADTWDSPDTCGLIVTTVMGGDSKSGVTLTLHLRSDLYSKWEKLDERAVILGMRSGWRRFPKLGKCPLLFNMETWVTRFGWLGLRSPGKLPAFYLTLCHWVLLVCWFEYFRVKIETLPGRKVRVLTLREPDKQRLTFEFGILLFFFLFFLHLWGSVLLAGLWVRWLRVHCSASRSQL